MDICPFTRSPKNMQHSLIAVWLISQYSIFEGKLRLRKSTKWTLPSSLLSKAYGVEINVMGTMLNHAASLLPTVDHEIQTLIQEHLTQQQFDVLADYRINVATLDTPENYVVKMLNQHYQEPALAQMLNHHVDLYGSDHLAIRHRKAWAKLWHSTEAKTDYEALRSIARL